MTVTCRYRASSCPIGEILRANQQTGLIGGKPFVVEKIEGRRVAKGKLWEVTFELFPSDRGPTIDFAPIFGATVP